MKDKKTKSSNVFMIKGSFYWSNIKCCVSVSVSCCSGLCPPSCPPLLLHDLTSWSNITFILSLILYVYFWFFFFLLISSCFFSTLVSACRRCQTQIKTADSSDSVPTFSHLCPSLSRLCPGSVQPLSHFCPTSVPALSNLFPTSVLSSGPFLVLSSQFSLCSPE